MNYVYLRVSKDTQDADNQRHGVLEYCVKNDIAPLSFLEDTASGKTDWKVRALGDALQAMQAGDVLIVSEISRLSRNTIGVLEVLEHCIANKITVHVVKQNMVYGDDIQSKVMATMFALAAQIERELISERTKEGLARRKAEGVKIGRPKGIGKRKLDKRENEVRALFYAGYKMAQIARLTGVSPSTVSNYLKLKGLKNEPISKSTSAEEVHNSTESV